MVNLLCRVNISNAGFNFLTQPSYYTTLDLTNDKLIWTAGSSEVYNHCGYLPSATQLNEAATLITTSDVEIANCFLYDFQV